MALRKSGTLLFGILLVGCFLGGTICRAAQPEASKESTPTGAFGIDYITASSRRRKTPKSSKVGDIGSVVVPVPVVLQPPPVTPKLEIGQSPKRQPRRRRRRRKRRKRKRKRRRKQRSPKKIPMTLTTKPTTKPRRARRGPSRRKDRPRRTIPTWPPTDFNKESSRPPVTSNLGPINFSPSPTSSVTASPNITPQGSPTKDPTVSPIGTPPAATNAVTVSPNASPQGIPTNIPTVSNMDCDESRGSFGDTTLTTNDRLIRYAYDIGITDDNEMILELDILPSITRQVTENLVALWGICDGSSRKLNSEESKRQLSGRRSRRLALVGLSIEDSSILLEETCEGDLPEGAVLCKVVGGLVRLHLVNETEDDSNQVNNTLAAIADGVTRTVDTNPKIARVIYRGAQIEAATINAPTTTVAPTPSLNLLPTRLPSSPTDSPTISLKPSSISGINLPFEYLLEFLGLEREFTKEQEALLSKAFMDSYNYTFVDPTILLPMPPQINRMRPNLVDSFGAIIQTKKEWDRNMTTEGCGGAR
eukprot:scaffold34333_cov68-Attheya_sp.AAC.1